MSGFDSYFLSVCVVGGITFLAGIIMNLISDKENFKKIGKYVAYISTLLIVVIIVGSIILAFSYKWESDIFNIHKSDSLKTNGESDSVDDENNATIGDIYTNDNDNTNKDSEDVTQSSALDLNQEGTMQIPIRPTAQEPAESLATTAPANVTLISTDFTANVGDEYRIEYNLSDKDLIPNWKSSDINVVTVSSDGIVTLMTAGEAVITVSVNGGNSESLTIIAKDLPTYMFDVIQEYEHNGYSQTAPYVPFKMLGKTYDNGCLIQSSPVINGYVKYNLDKKYNTIRGIMGYVDNNDKPNTRVIIYLDGKIYATYELSEFTQPTIDFEIDVTGAGIMYINIIPDGGIGGGTPRIGFGNVTIE